MLSIAEWIISVYIVRVKCIIQFLTHWLDSLCKYHLFDHQYFCIISYSILHGNMYFNSISMYYLILIYISLKHNMKYRELKNT